MSENTSAAGAHTAAIDVHVKDSGGQHAAVAHAWVALYHAPYEAGETLPAGSALVARQRTDAHGRAHFARLAAGTYHLVYLHYPKTVSKAVTVHAGCCETVCIEPVINATLTTSVRTGDCQPLDCRGPQQGDYVLASVGHDLSPHVRFVAPAEASAVHAGSQKQAEYSSPLNRAGQQTLAWRFQLPMLDSAAADLGAEAGPAEIVMAREFNVGTKRPTPVSGQLGISLTRSETESTPDLPLWVAIRNGTEALSFNNYLRYMDLLFTPGHKGHGAGFEAEKEAFRKLKHRRFLPFTDTDSYRVLKAATEAFVMVNCAVLGHDKPDKAFNPRDDNAYLDRRGLPGFENFRAAFDDYLEPLGERGVLPYLALVRRKLPDVPIVDFDHEEANLSVGLVQDKLTNPCLIELIWSYWHEEAMLVQTMNAVTRRFQNRRSQGSGDPLANLEIDPLRPLNNLIWGYTQDEQHRLTVNRRNHEYDHEYGLRLQGRAVQDFRPADTRSQFLEAFHHLLRLCTVFYRQDDDTTVKADAFPVLNALKEVHLVMSQGAHNQMGDMPSTARIEMLMQQWLLGRPEFREFLPTRVMVAYPEPWMDRVDAMKKLQGWTDTSVVHFRNLAIFGEQLLLSIRYGAWSEVYEPTQAFNWARFWRPQVQGYNHGYRAATGIDLGAETSNATADATLPSLLMQKRLAQQQQRSA